MIKIKIRNRGLQIRLSKIPPKKHDATKRGLILNSKKFSFFNRVIMLTQIVPVGTLATIQSPGDCWPEKRFYAYDAPYIYSSAVTITGNLVTSSFNGFAPTI